MNCKSLVSVRFLCALGYLNMLFSFYALFVQINFDKFISPRFFVSLESMSFVYLCFTAAVYLLFFVSLFEFRFKENQVLRIKDLSEIVLPQTSISRLKSGLFYFGLVYDSFFTFFYTSFLVFVYL